MRDRRQAATGNLEREAGLLTPGVSVVVPCYNSSRTLPHLVEELAEVLPSCANAFEVLLVNDASPDDTWAVIEQLADRYPCVVGIDLGRNFGQHNATLCGVRMARHDVTVTMDDDLQQPPAEIPKLLGKLAEGYDLVYGVSTRVTHSLYRRSMSWLIRLAVRTITRQREVRDLSPFRAMRTNVRAAFSEFRSPHSLFDVLVSWGTNRVTTTPVIHHPRRTGRSNYNFLKLVHAALLLWTGYSTAPLRFASLLGFGFTLFGFGAMFYHLLIYFTQGSVPGFTFLASTVTLFSGAQLFALGVIGEYLARMFHRSTGHPVYVVRRTTRGDRDSTD